MTVPSYTEDLTDIATGDEAAGWVELTGTDQDSEVYNAQGSPVYEDDEFPYIQGLYAVIQTCTKSTAIGSLAYNAGGITVPTDGAVFVWQNFSSPFAMGTYAQGGYRLVLGSGLGDFDVWYVGGSDKDNNPYGGFVSHVVNPTVTRDTWAGTHTGTINYVASAVYVITGPGKGSPHQCDVMRYGRGSAIFEHGEAADYATIAGFAAINDNQSNRWGLIQVTPGGFLWKGQMQLGSASNPVDFRDSNFTVFIQWTPKVTANFNTINIVNASSNVEMTGFQFICLDPAGTASKGRWITTNDATVALVNGSFIDMGTFVFDSNTTLDIVTFKRCGQATQAGAAFDACIFDNSDAAVSLVADSLADIADCVFTSDGSNHAVDLGTISTTQAINWNNYLSGYATSDGSTGNEAIKVSVDVDKVLTINVGAGYDTPFIYNTGAGTVTVVAGAVSVTVTAKTTLGVVIENVRVILRASDGTGPFPFDETVTIVNSGTTATVTHTAHGVATGDKMQFLGASLAANNGTFLLTVTDVDTYTYTMLSTPGSSPTGTIKATFVALSGLTNGSGIITTSRVYTSDQPIEGHARKNTTAPFYVTAPLIDTIDSADGFAATAVMILD